MILFPIAHENQKVQRLPWITILLIAVNVVAYLLILSSSAKDRETQVVSADFYSYYSQHPYLKLPPETEKHFSSPDLDTLRGIGEGMRDSVPESTREKEQAELERLGEKLQGTEEQDASTRLGYAPASSHFPNLITYMFVHASIFQLLGNLFFLYLIGFNIEDLWGRPIFSGFYFLSGAAAALVYSLVSSGSQIPLLGADGAVAALMGAFLVRLAKTRIHFFYFVGFRMRGTFSAPAFMVFPLWLVKQLWFVFLTDAGQRVPFWANISGFAFGALFALAMKQLRIEEKYISPAIEKKVTLQQNPDFLKAMDFSEQGRFASALPLLQKVVQAEPNHMEAYMEMRRIAEVAQDMNSYARYTGAILEILVRAKDRDFLLELYSQYESHPDRRPLPARTLSVVSGMLEQETDPGPAVRCLEELVNAYPEDIHAMKAYSKLARLYFDRTPHREKAIEAFWKSYHHNLATAEWKSALRPEIKKYDIPLQEKPAEAAVVAPASSPEQIPITLPDPEFDGPPCEWNVVSCRMEKLVLKGMILRNQTLRTGFLPWDRIKTVSVGKVSRPNEKPFLVVDLICLNSGIVLYRTFSYDIAFDKIFPRVEQSFTEAYENWMGILLRSSGCTPLPDRQRCSGPSFAGYSDTAEYDRRLREQVGNRVSR